MKILITGIAGTLGMAFTNLLHADHELSGVDHNEQNVALFLRKYPDIRVRVGDFDKVDVDGLNLVIHLAAMKHIDLAEANPNACVFNNIIRTYLLFQNVHINHVDILFMSTDKAVEPISVYGYTKALAERMVLEYGGAIVRSGNIVVSNGSVLEMWDKAIEEGKPIRVTHKDMERHFITADNLVKRIWEKYLKGERSIFPEMDRTVKLMDLVKEKLEAHGLKDYPIEFIGLRPGEKLIEKLKWPGEE